MNANGAARVVPERHRWLRAVEARIDGQVVEVPAGMHGLVDRVLIAEGALVEKGELLVELDHGELDRRVEAAATELDRAVLESMSTRGSTGLQPLRMLSRVEFGSSPTISRAREKYLRAHLSRSSADVRAPVAGRVLARNVQPRDPASPAKPLISILDSDDLWVLARFGRQEFDRLRLGQDASVRAGGRYFPARVAGLSGREEPALLEFIARPAVALRPGTIASAAVDAG